MQIIHQPIANRLLAALPHLQYQKIQADLEFTELHFGDVLVDAGAKMDYVYFPGNCLISLLTVIDKHEALEVGMVGREGFVGASLALGVTTSSFRALVQGTGTAMRMQAPAFLRAFNQGQAMQKEVLLYTHTLMNQIAQSAACNRFHLIEARLARWLLMTRDRIGTNHFHLTHEFLGNMLGVRRVGVTNAAHALKDRGLIDYSRGNIEIIDGQQLELAACSCYQMGLVKQK